ncbi:phosphatidylinositol-3,5-bisphosphate 5-phosphatase, partial [Oleoguttula sp. CCFEE 5521]
VDYDTDAVNIFTHMFHDHGDTIAVQYGGSHLVNTMATYRKLNHWQSHSQNMVESFKRYYHNSFLDNQRQEAYNLFLGNYVWVAGQPMLWDLTTDYYLHHSDPRSWLRRERRDYYQWFTPEYLEPRQLPPAVNGNSEIDGHELVDFDDYWLEFYRPTTLSSFLKLYTYRMNNTQRYLPDRPARDHKTFDFSPFKPRLEPHRQNSIDSPDKKPLRKGVTIVDPIDQPPNAPLEAQTSRPHIKFNDEPSSILRERMHRRPNPVAAATPDPADKAQMHLWSLNQFHTNSLNPSVTASETAEYSRYITHPLTLPLVTATIDIPSDTNLDYLSYLSRADDASDREDFGVSDHDMREFEAFLAEREEVLTVLEEDGGKKRYKAYKQWLRGKSLFKQSKVDPEYLSGV